MAMRRIREFLDGNKAMYAVISHSPAFTAQEVAESAHIPGRDLAKVVVVNLDGRLALAVVPANREVDIARLRHVAGAQFAMLAEEEEFATRFEGCQVGAMPPFGNVFGMETYFDTGLGREEYIAFNAGTHTDLIAMKSADYRRLANPRVADIAQ